MSDHPARRLWLSLETLHDVVYFAPEIRDAGIGLGLRGGCASAGCWPATRRSR